MSYILSAPFFQIVSRLAEETFCTPTMLVLLSGSNSLNSVLFLDYNPYLHEYASCYIYPIAHAVLVGLILKQTRALALNSQ